MRICFLIRSMPAIIKGGMENHTFLLATELVKKRHDVTILTTSHPGGSEHEEVNGIAIYYLKNTIPGKYSRSWWTASAQKFEELHKKNPFNVIHSQSAGAYSLLMKGLNKRYDVPVVITFHGFSYDNIKNVIRNPFSSGTHSHSFKSLLATLPELYSLVSRDLGFIRRADALIAVNESQMQSLHEVLFHLNTPVFLIYNGIDTDFFSPVPTRSVRGLYGIKPDDILLLSVSRLTWAKGVQYLISALPALLNRHNIKLIIVGTGNYKFALRTIVKKLKLDGYVFFANFVPDEDICAFFNSCDIFVNPTLYDVSPLTLLEAMACQKPVIASTLGAIPAIIDHGKEGLLVPSGDVDALTRSIDYVLSNPPLMKSLGSNAREKVLKEFSSESMCEKVIRVYEHVLSKNSKN
jgi:glycosyltransferase involved in cell wall biosynthesis